MTDKLVCLECTLPICRESDPGCAFYQITPRKSQAESYRRYYAENREKEIKRVMEWGKGNIERRRETQRAYYHRKRSERIAAYHANKPPSRDERRAMTLGMLQQGE